MRLFEETEYMGIRILKPYKPAEKTFTVDPNQDYLEQLKALAELTGARLKYLEDK